VLLAEHHYAELSIPLCGERSQRIYAATAHAQLVKNKASTTKIAQVEHIVPPPPLAT
jgi:hypothetical protein